MTVDRWDSTTLRSCLREEFPGEWGAEAGNAGGNATVLRSTDIDDEGHVDCSAGARRTIPADKISARQLRNGDVLLETSGGGPDKPVGRVALFRGEHQIIYLCSNFFRTLRPEPARVDPAFLAWRLQLLYRHPSIWRFQQQTTGIINLKLQDYLNSVLELPRSLDEQRRVAEILDTLDEAIRRTEQIIAKLKQIKQGLLHDLLTRGIDENGQLRDPERHPDQFKDSPLGRIPSEWGMQPLGKISDLGVGYAFKSEWFSDQEGTRLLRGECWLWHS